MREVELGETRRVARAMLELRPHYESPEGVAARIDELRGGGYRVVGSFDGSDDEAGAVAGFRVSESLAWDRFVYVDDLVTRAALRGRGHADAVMAWVADEARRLGCTQLHLDSGVGADRADAHRFYFRHGMRIVSYHFARGLR